MNPEPLLHTAVQPLASATLASSIALASAYGSPTPNRRLTGSSRAWAVLPRLEHRPVDPVARHQLLRLGRERLRLGVEGRGLGLGEQGADLVEDTLW